MFCDIYVSLKQPFCGVYKFEEFALFDFCFARQIKNWMSMNLGPIILDTIIKKMMVKYI